MSKITGNIQERITQRVTKVESGCWEWNLRLDRFGYGYARINRRHMLAHRASYEAFVGKIPDGLTIDHLCKNKRCVNPDHMEAVTNKENILRSDCPSAIAARRDHCQAGHAYTEENTRKDADGHRFCRACCAAYARAYRLRRKS